MGGVPSGGNTFKNILIGIGTTVAAYAIVHFIFDKKGGEKSKVKTATVEAWSSLLRYEEMSMDNYYLLQCTEDPETQEENMIYETEQMIRNYEILKAKPDIDVDMAAFITRAIGNKTEYKKAMENYLTEWKALNAQHQSGIAVDSQVARLNERYTKKLRSLDLEDSNSRDTKSIRAIFSVLNEKYGDDFEPPTKLTTIQENQLLGKWKEVGLEKVFDFKEGNKVVMTADSVDYPGKWSVSDTTIALTFTDGTVNLHLSRLHQRYFTWRLNDESTRRQCCKKD